jgi:hypothetical protein
VNETALSLSEMTKWDPKEYPSYCAIPSVARVAEEAIDGRADKHVLHPKDDCAIA